MAGAEAKRCAYATDLCSMACEVALAADPSYTSPGTEPYSEAQLALVSCASVCTLLARALRGGDADLELVRWCAEICVKCAATDGPDGVPAAQWGLVVNACRKSAALCNLLIDSISQCTRSALSWRDTDVQAWGT